MSTITAVKACAATKCAFNNNGCTAVAVTIGGAEKAACETLTIIDARAGLSSANGQVGACKRLECKHNSDLLCTAAGIDLDDVANCASYEAR